MNVDRIEFLKQKGYIPLRVLDIGCHLGEFSKEIKRIWPTTDLFLMDANPYLEQEVSKLNLPYKICLLGKENKQNVTFFLTKKWLLSTGNSIYRENTNDFADEFLQTVELEMYKLDDLFPDQTFNFIKMDTQGSEVDIITGGQNLVSRADFVMLECSIMEYNKGGANISDVFKIMDSLGFKMYDLVDLFYKNDDLCQIDILFKKYE